MTRGYFNISEVLILVAVCEPNLVERDKHAVIYEIFLNVGITTLLKCFTLPVSAFAVL